MYNSVALALVTLEKQLDKSPAQKVHLRKPTGYTVTTD